MLALLVIAVLRVGGHHGRVVSVVQLPLTVALVLVLAGLLEVGSAAYSPGAGDNASGVAVALELARALGAAPPRRLAVDIVLQGAGDGEAIGLRKHIRAHKRELPRANTVVVGVGPCGAGDPRYLLSDGSFVPLAYASSLCKLSAQLADGTGDLGADGHRGRGTSPAFPARAARLPAIAVCSLDARGLVPRSHQAADVPAEIDDDAIARTVSFALMLIDAIDSAVPRRRERTSPTPA
jgi:hypothetical protein